MRALADCGPVLPRRATARGFFVPVFDRRLSIGLSFVRWRSCAVGRKLAGDERLSARWRAAQELSLGPFTIGAINRNRQFSLLHGAAKARVAGNLEEARHS